MARDNDGSLRITSASRPKSEDIAGRQRRYLISMGIRTVCVVLAVVFMGHWVMWVFAVGAIFLPYVAVVAANATNPDPGGNDHAYQPGVPMIERGGTESPER